MRFEFRVFNYRDKRVNCVYFEYGEVGFEVTNYFFGDPFGVLLGAELGMTAFTNGWFDED